VRPSEAVYSEPGEFILRYDDVRRASDPPATIAEFLRSTYEAGAGLRHWDHSRLERTVPDLRRRWRGQAG
jgi:hypothetical protein